MYERGTTMEIKRVVKYENELDKGFAAEIASIQGGEKLWSCIQCGTCSGICPMSIYMDYTPRRLIAMTRAGFRDEVLNSFTIWLCASCYACTVQCPAGIKITDIMYALKRKAIKEGIYPKRFPIPVLAREFYDMVKGYGRSTESWLATKLALKTDRSKLFKMMPLGLKLLRKGRMGFKKESIRGKKQLETILNALEEEA